MTAVSATARAAVPRYLEGRVRALDRGGSVTSRVCVAVVLSLIGACAPPPAQGVRLRIVGQAGAQPPPELRLTWIGEGRVLLADQRVPLAPRRVALAGGEELASVLIE